MSTFNIGSQSAGGAVNNVGGDMTVSGGQWTVGGVSALDVARQMQQLAESLRSVDLPDAVRDATRQDVERVDRELRRPEPDRDVVAALAHRIVGTLERAGALVAGAPVVQSLHGLLTWLGSAGQALARLLPG